VHLAPSAKESHAQFLGILQCGCGLKTIMNLYYTAKNVKIRTTVSLQYQHWTDRNGIIITIVALSVLAPVDEQ